VGTKNKNKNIYNNNNLAVVSSSEDIIDDNKIRMMISDELAEG